MNIDDIIRNEEVLDQQRLDKKCELHKVLEEELPKCAAKVNRRFFTELSRLTRGDFNRAGCVTFTLPIYLDLPDNLHSMLLRETFMIKKYPYNVRIKDYQELSTLVVKALKLNLQDNLTLELLEESRCIHLTIKGYVPELDKRLCGRLKQLLRRNRRVK